MPDPIVILDDNQERWGVRRDALLRVLRRLEWEVDVHQGLVRQPPGEPEAYIQLCEALEPAKGWEPGTCTDDRTDGLPLLAWDPGSGFWCSYDGDGMPCSLRHVERRPA